MLHKIFVRTPPNSSLRSLGNLPIMSSKKRDYASLSTATLMKKKARYEKKRAVFVQRRIEKKGLDTAIGVGPVINTTNTNGNCFVLNLVRQGAGSWERIGRKIQLTSLRLKGSFLNDYTSQASTGNIPANYIRMVVVWDRQPSGGAIPTWDSVFSQTAQDGTESSNVMAQLAYDNMDRFQILRDVCVGFSPEATNTSGGSANLVQSVATFDEFINLKGKEVVFLGQSQPMTISDISTGGLYVYFRAKENIAATSLVYVNTPSWARLRYTDL